MQDFTSTDPLLFEIVSADCEELCSSELFEEVRVLLDIPDNCNENSNQAQNELNILEFVPIQCLWSHP